MVTRTLRTMLFRMVKNGKSQFVGVIAIIVIGITLFTALGMTSDNMGTTVDSYYASSRFPDLFVQTAGAPVQAVEQIAGLEGVTAASGRISMDGPFVTAEMEERVNVRVVTVPADGDPLSRNFLLQGSGLSGAGNEVLLIEPFARARDIGVGDTIEIQLRGVRYKLSVAGIVANPEYIYMMENAQSIMPNDEKFGVCYVEESLGRRMMGFAGSYNEILVELAAGTDREAAIDRVESVLDRYGIKQIVEKEDQMSYAILAQELMGLEAMSKSIPILFVCVAALILVMMLSRMVKKDRGKIGILKALGYTDGQVVAHYALYAVAAGSIGGLLGIAAGLAVAGAMTRLYLEFFHIPLLRVEFYFSYVALAVLLSAGLCALAGLFGARGVLKIAPAESMREEAPKTGRRILLERWPSFWKRLSFSHKLVLRNTFRKKRRAAFVMLGVTVTYAMMLFTTSMPDVVDQMTTRHFKEFQKMNYSISFHVPTTRKAVRDLEKYVDASLVEEKLEFPFELSRGHRKQVVALIGLRADTRFYTFKNPAGQILPVPAEGILLSSHLATLLDVGPGDRIRIKSYLPGRDEIDVTVAGIVKQALGMNAYMEIGRMGELLLEKNAVNGVYLNSDDPELYEKLLRASNVATVLSVMDMRTAYDDYMQMTVGSIGFLVLLSGILGFVIVYNATILAINEREMEFSSLRVLGFSKGDLFTLLLKETAIVAILGVLLGIPAGMAMTRASSAAFTTELYSLEMRATPGAGIAAGLLTLLFVVLALAATYWKINRLDFMQALKNRAG